MGNNILTLRDRLTLDGPIAQNYQKFIEWASAYDTGGYIMRSRVVHEQLIDELSDLCITHIIEGDFTTESQISQIFALSS